MSTINVQNNLDLTDYSVLLYQNDEPVEESMVLTSAENFKGEKGEKSNIYRPDSAPDNALGEPGDMAIYPESNKLWMVVKLDEGWDIANKVELVKGVNSPAFLTVPFSAIIELDVQNQNKHAVSITNTCTISIANSENGDMGVLMLQNNNREAIELGGTIIGNNTLSELDLLEWFNKDGVIYWAVRSQGNTAGAYRYKTTLPSGTTFKVGQDISGGWRGGDLLQDGQYYVGPSSSLYIPQNKILAIPNVPIRIYGTNRISYAWIGKDNVVLDSRMGFIGEFEAPHPNGFNHIVYPPEGAIEFRFSGSTDYPAPASIAGTGTSQWKLMYGHLPSTVTVIANALTIAPQTETVISAMYYVGIDPKVICLPAQKLDNLIIKARVVNGFMLQVSACNFTNQNVAIPSNTNINVKFLSDYDLFI